MAVQVNLSASLMFTMGAAPSALVVLLANKTMAENKPDADIMDHKPFVNVPPFAMCKSPNAHALSTGKAGPLDTRLFSRDVR
jgi:hypothetical protein